MALVVSCGLEPPAGSDDPRWAAQSWDRGLRRQAQGVQLGEKRQQPRAGLLRVLVTLCVDKRLSSYLTP